MPQRGDPMQHLQELFQSNQYNRCVGLVYSLLAEGTAMSAFLSCKLLHILAVSLLRTDRVGPAHKALERLWDIIQHNKALTQGERETWRVCCVNDKTEALECAYRPYRVHQVLSGTSTSLLSSTGKDNSTPCSQQLLAFVETGVRRDLSGDARSFLESTQQFLLQPLDRRNASANVSSASVVSEIWSANKSTESQKKRIVGDKRVELRSMEKALEVLMQHKPFNDAERFMLLKQIAVLALEYMEKLLRAGTVVKSILPRTAENLYLALETMERYLQELPEPLPSFTHLQLKLARLLIILGPKNFTPSVENKQFLDHAAQMVEEFLHELMDISSPSSVESDMVLAKSWTATRTRLIASGLEAKGNILTTQGRHQAAVESFKQSIDKYDIALSTNAVNISERKNIYSYYDEYFEDDNYCCYMDNVPFRIRLRFKLAWALSDGGRHGEALELLSSTRSILDTTFESVSSGSVALIVFAEGAALSGCHRLEEARQSYEMVLEYIRKSEYDLLYAVVMDHLAELSLWRGNIELSLEFYHHALRLRRRSIGECHLDAAASHRNLSETLFLLHRYKEAERHADECMRLVKDLYSGVCARRLYGHRSTPERSRRVGLFPLWYVPSPESVAPSLYLQHPLYLAAARRKSECIKCR